jgi:hypothetical protein
MGDDDLLFIEAIGGEHGSNGQSNASRLRRELGVVGPEVTAERRHATWMSAGEVAFGFGESRKCIGTASSDGRFPDHFGQFRDCENCNVLSE